MNPAPPVTSNVHCVLSFACFLKASRGVYSGSLLRAPAGTGRIPSIELLTEHIELFRRDKAAPPGDLLNAGNVESWRD
jgi:hypothetical protein